VKEYCEKRSTDANFRAETDATRERLVAEMRAGTLVLKMLPAPAEPDPRLTLLALAGWLCCCCSVVLECGHGCWAGALSGMAGGRYRVRLTGYKIYQDKLDVNEVFIVAQKNTHDSRDMC